MRTVLYNRPVSPSARKCVLASVHWPQCFIKFHVFYALPHFFDTSHIIILSGQSYNLPGMYRNYECASVSVQVLPTNVSCCKWANETLRGGGGQKQNIIH
jgi:hypothetical protein